MKYNDDDKIIDITNYKNREEAEVFNVNVRGFHTKQEKIKQNHQNIFNNLMMQVVLVNQVITYIILYYLAIR